MNFINKTWFIIAVVLITVFLTTAVFRGEESKTDIPQNESEQRLQELEDVRAKYPAPNDTTIDDRLYELEEIREEFEAPNDMTIEERVKNLEQLESVN
mgnify:CR=1 FL=1|jgi:hypothetical protein